MTQSQKARCAVEQAERKERQLLCHGRRLDWFRQSQRMSLRRGESDGDIGVEEIIEGDSLRLAE